MLTPSSREETEEEKFESIQKMTLPQREQMLLRILDEVPYLIMLDGLEQLLIAYQEHPTASVESEKDNSELPLDENSQEPYSQQLRNAKNPRVDTFIKRLADTKTSRILISSRLAPKALETISGELIPNAFIYPLEGLTDVDAIELWKSQDMEGEEEKVLNILNEFGNSPLFIKLVVGAVRTYRRAPGDFNQWLETISKEKLFNLPAIEKTLSNQFSLVLKGLTDQQQQAINAIAHFKQEIDYLLLAKFLIECLEIWTGENELNDALVEFENRGILEWDREQNTYFMHPVLRGLIWSRLNVTEQDKISTLVQSCLNAK